jgi:cell surface protein SprA
VNNARIDEPYGRLDTKAKKDSVRDNFMKGGRNTHYHQEGTLAYNVPTAKLPLLDWTQMRVSYTAKYDWLAGSLLARELGNTLFTGQTRNATADLDFDRLYNKWRFLQAVNSDASQQAAPPQQPQPQQPRDTATKKRRRAPGEPIHIAAVPKFFLRMATSLKRIGIQYNEGHGHPAAGLHGQHPHTGYEPP